jgi:Fic/DOC family protein
MATPAERLASSLEVLLQLQAGNRGVFRSSEFSRTHRDRLVTNGYLAEPTRGWLIAMTPEASGLESGDTTPWYTSFWEFCGQYATGRFAESWHLSSEQSLLLAAENWSIPSQVVICSPNGSNNTLALPFNTGLFDLKEPRPLGSDDITLAQGLRILRPEIALTRVPESFFKRRPVEAQTILQTLRNPTALVQRLLEGGHSHVSGRIAGAFRAVGMRDAADSVIAAMNAAGYDVREMDPFQPDSVRAPFANAVSPVASRIQALWSSMRDRVAREFPREPTDYGSRHEVLKSIDERYQADAYHSLSIEGYRVSSELITRVRTGAWDPDGPDRNHRDALAARGYWLAFQSVRRSVSEIMSGANPVEIARADHPEWYRQLFQPSVAAGIIPASALAGYRQGPVYLRGSRHVPPRAETVVDGVEAIFDCMAQEARPSVRAVLGHWLLGYVHPYPDGNGRMARFLMNVMLAAGGYPWTIIPMEGRTAYLEALESASVAHEIQPFAQFVARQVGR